MSLMMLNCRHDARSVLLRLVFPSFGVHSLKRRCHSCQVSFIFPSELFSFILFLVIARNYSTPANTRRWSNVGLMLAQRLRRWSNISPTLGQRLVFAGRRPALVNVWTTSGRCSMFADTSRTANDPCLFFHTVCII